MVLVLQLVGSLLAWASVCLAIYSALRLFGRRFRLALCVFGALALGVWCMVLGAFIVDNSGFIGMPGDGSHPFPFALIGRVSATLLLMMSCGGAILHRATQKQWNWLHCLLFCGLYLAAVHGLFVFALVSSSGGRWEHLARPLPNSWNQLLGPVRFSPWGGPYFDSLTAFLFWVFPLGAPCLEIIFNSFKRAHSTNKTGSLV